MVSVSMWLPVLQCQCWCESYLCHGDGVNASVRTTCITVWVSVWVTCSWCLHVKGTCFMPSFQPLWCSFCTFLKVSLSTSTFTLSPRFSWTWSGFTTSAQPHVNALSSKNQKQLSTMEKDWLQSGTLFKAFLFFKRTNQERKATCMSAHWPRRGRCSG